MTIFMEKRWSYPPKWEFFGVEPNWLTGLGVNVPRGTLRVPARCADSRENRIEAFLMYCAQKSWVLIDDAVSGCSTWNKSAFIPASRVIVVLSRDLHTVYTQLALK